MPAADPSAPLKERYPKTAETWEETRRDGFAKRIWLQDNTPDATFAAVLLEGIGHLLSAVGLAHLLSWAFVRWTPIGDLLDEGSLASLAVGLPAVVYALVLVVGGFFGGLFVSTGALGFENGLLILSRVNPQQARSLRGARWRLRLSRLLLLLPFYVLTLPKVITMLTPYVLGDGVAQVLGAWSTPAPYAVLALAALWLLHLRSVGGKVRPAVEQALAADLAARPLPPKQEKVPATPGGSLDD